MITISSITTNEFCSEITVAATAAAGSSFTQILFWTTATYKDYTAAVDISSFASGATANFTLQPADVGLTSFEGAYFLEFTQDPATGDQDIVVASTQCFKSILTCLTEKLLAVDITACDVENICAKDDVVFYHSLFENMKELYECGYFKEAIQANNLLDAYCNCESTEKNDIIEC